MVKGKVAIVTGAAGRGMGRSIALTLAREGARVVVNYRTSEESARDIVAHIEGRGGDAVAVQADVFEAGGCKRLVVETLARFGQVAISASSVPAAAGIPSRLIDSILTRRWRTCATS
jgi:3-oxoacyl-[acyl-carrier protein] reductase